MSFAKANDLPGLVSATIQVSTRDLLARSFGDLPVGSKETNDSVIRLIAMAWGKMVKDRKLPTCRLSQDRQCVYFHRTLLAGEYVSFVGPDGKSGRRQLVGYRTVWNAQRRSKVQRYWHFGVHVEPRLYPRPVLVIMPHVVFSDDGATIWDSASRLHRARRSQCTGWWNPHWRDRILASVGWLCGQESKLLLPVASDVQIGMSKLPVTFQSPVCFDDADAVQAPEDLVDDRDEDLEIPDDGEEE